MNGISGKSHKSLGITRDKTYLLNEYKDGLNCRRNNRFDINRYSKNWKIWVIKNRRFSSTNKNSKAKVESFLSNDSTDESTTIELGTTTETPEYVLIYDNTTSL